MTIESEAAACGRGLADASHEEMIQFVFRAPSAAGLLHGARALLGGAPRELSDSFEQAVRSSGLAS